MNAPIPKPTPFLSVRVQEQSSIAELLGLCAGYETGAWRAKEFAKYLIRCLPQFVLPAEEWKSFNTANGVELIAQAARSVYSTSKYAARGEIGELMLFAILREYYDTIPLISKLYFKSSANDTVKGFDAVHIVSTTSGPELWLGEVKFYSSIHAAIRDVVAELGLVDKG